MSVERVDDFGAVALMAAARDLTAPLVLLRQLSFQLEQQPELQQSLSTRQALERMRLTIKQTFDIADQLKLAVSGTEQLALEPVQLVGLCNELDNELRPLQRELNCTVDFELPRRHDQLVAVGNYQALRTVVAGFLTDALRYSQPADSPATEQANCQQRPASTAGQRLVRLRVLANRQGQAAITIEDNADSISLAQSLQAAASLDNSNPTLNRPLMGSLNLLLADRLIRAMNGRLVVHNHRQGGLTIETRLPLSRQLSLLEAS